MYILMLIFVVLLASLYIFESIQPSNANPFMSHHPKNEPDGFRGIKWGDKPSWHPELVRVGRDEQEYDTEEEIDGWPYINIDENLRIGNAEISTIIYSFNEENDFTCVIAYVEKTRKDVDALRYACVSEWGKPVEVDSADDGSKMLVWDWKMVRAGVGFSKANEAFFMIIFNKYNAMYSEKSYRKRHAGF